MENFKNTKGTPTKRTNAGAKDRINLDYDFNTEYGDGDIPDIDKPGSLVDDDMEDYNDRY